MYDDIELSRRKALAALGTIGAASVGAGLGTSAYFSDQETFENNELVAGTLDLKVSWEEHYSDWSEDEAEHASMVDGELVVDDRQGFMNATLQEEFPDKRTKRAIDAGEVDPCEALADVGDDDVEAPVIGLEDVKPGDFGEVTFDFSLCDNPGYLWLNGELLECAENGLTEPEADDPDEDGMNAGFGSGAAGLLGSLAASRLGADAEGADADSDDDDRFGISKKQALRGTLGAGVGAVGLGASTGAASAAPGDSLASGTLTGTPNGAGITFDGEYVYTVGFDGTTVRVYDPLDGGTKSVVATKSLSDPIDVIEWDPDEGAFWGVQGNFTGPEFFLFDLGDPTVSEAVTGTAQFSPDEPIETLLDGLAYDGTSETLWLSPDGSTRVWQYDKSGSQTAVSPITPEFNPAGDPFDHISGLAVGAPLNGRPTLYVGNNPVAANGDIGRVYADDGEFVSTFATSTGFRVEDIACDPITFDSEALIVRDNFDQYEVFEVEQGTCPVAGEPETDPDACAGELQDALQVTIWYDDDCDNLVDDTEELVFEGTLAEAMERLSSGNGLPLAGNIDAADGGGTGRNCYSAAPDRHCVGFKWELPVDHANELQSDSVRFDLGFYTEQCRHNDGSGMNNAGVDDDEVDA